ncbi:MAG: hypothetical protein WC369_02150 [Dehalococcoidales bacterium]|jgi:hypothetical protein
MPVENTSQKVTYVILTAVISILLTLIFVKTYQKAEDAYASTCVNTTEIAVLKKADEAFVSGLKDINVKLDQILKISIRQ